MIDALIERIECVDIYYFVTNAVCLQRPSYSVRDVKIEWTESIQTAIDWSLFTPGIEGFIDAIESIRDDPVDYQNDSRVRVILDVLEAIFGRTFPSISIGELNEDVNFLRSTIVMPDPSPPDPQFKIVEVSFFENWLAISTLSGRATAQQRVIFVPPAMDGVIVQKVRLNGNHGGAPVVYRDRLIPEANLLASYCGEPTHLVRFPGDMDVTFYELWEVVNGEVIVDVDGNYHDIYAMPAFEAGSMGTFEVDGEAKFFPLHSRSDFPEILDCPNNTPYSGKLPSTAPGVNTPPYAWNNTPPGLPVAIGPRQHDLVGRYITSWIGLYEIDVIHKVP